MFGLSRSINDQVNQSKTWSGLAEGASNPPIFIPQLMRYARAFRWTRPHNPHNEHKSLTRGARHRLHEAGAFPVETISRAYPVEQYEEALAAMCDSPLPSLSTTSMGADLDTLVVAGRAARSSSPSSRSDQVAEEPRPQPAHNRRLLDVPQYDTLLGFARSPHSR